jgi:hypothetical protein
MYDLARRAGNVALGTRMVQATESDENSRWHAHKRCIAVLAFAAFLSRM